MKPAKKTSKPAAPTPAKPAPALTVKPAAAKKAKPAPTKPAAINSAPAEPTHEAVALRAYQIWEKSGRPHGKSAEHWSQALAELKAGN